MSLSLSRKARHTLAGVAIILAGIAIGWGWDGIRVALGIAMIIVGVNVLPVPREEDPQ